MSNPIEKLIVGNIVEPVSEKYTLRSGCGYYSSAVVVSVNPFVLVSGGADMKWSYTVSPENFRVIGTTDKETLNKCLERL